MPHVLFGLCFVLCVCVCVAHTRQRPPLLTTIFRFIPILTELRDIHVIRFYSTYVKIYNIV